MDSVQRKGPVTIILDIAKAARLTMEKEDRDKLESCSGIVSS
jgi:hypothetical protein